MRTRRLWLRHGLLAGAGAGAAVLALLVHALGALAGLERDSVDARFGIRGTTATGGQIAIVGVDAATVAALGVRPPVPRAVYGQALDRLHALGARLVVFDVQFNGATDRRDDAALAAAIASRPPVVLATHDGPSGVVPVPVGHGRVPLGSAAVEVDSDGVLRRMLFAPVSLPTLAVRTAEFLTGRAVRPFASAWIDFRGPPGTFPTSSLIDLVRGRVPANAIAGKVVIVGVTDPAQKDAFVTAVSSVPMSGAEVQANALTTVLDGFPLSSAAGLVNVLLVIALALLPALVAARFSSLIAVGTAIGALIAFLILAQLAFNGGAIVAVADPVLALLLGVVGTVAADATLAHAQLRTLVDTGRSDFFICYRRGQSELAANTLREALSREVGARRVFMDTDAIEPGADWPKRLEVAIARARAVLVVIGPQWVACGRLEDSADWVRREIATALAAERVVVVPVLHDGAAEPRREDLPEPIAAIADRQAVELSGRDLKRWTRELLKSIGA